MENEHSAGNLPMFMQPKAAGNCKRLCIFCGPSQQMNEALVVFATFR
jgi:hypothetical protein